MWKRGKKKVERKVSKVKAKRVVKNKVKKRVSKSNKKITGHAVLSEALSDVSKELVKLKRDKVSLARKLSNFENEILQVQAYEVKLRDRITKLVSKESTINKKKGISQAKLLAIREKIAKIKQVQEELRDI